MTNVVLDGNIYDCLYRDKGFREEIARLIGAGALRVLVPRTVAEELYRSSFCGVPDFFPVEYTGNTVGRCGILRCGDSIGSGDIFDRHLGRSQKINDALIADAADCRAEWLISEDKRLRNRMAEVAQNSVPLSYTEFIERVRSLSS